MARNVPRNEFIGSEEASLRVPLALRLNFGGLEATVVPLVSSFYCSAKRNGSSLSTELHTFVDVVNKYLLAEITTSFFANVDP